MRVPDHAFGTCDEARRYLQVFSFFDQSLVDSGHVQFIDLGATLRGAGAEAALDRVAALVEELEPTVVAIDSFKAIHDILREAAKSRAVVTTCRSAWPAGERPAILVGEYTEAEVSVLPEFAIADGIIRLRNPARADHDPRGRGPEVARVRLRVGHALLRDSADGVHFFPRVRDAR